MKRKGGEAVKRIFAAVCAIMLIFALCISSFAVTLDYQGKEIKVGSLHNLNANVKYSWLNKLVLRDSATSVTTARLVPYADYPYSRTFEEFTADVADVMEMYSFDTNDVEDTYNEVIDLIYYTAVALGMTTDAETMLSTIQKEGIRVPVNMTAQEKVSAAVVYAAMKYDLTYALFERKTTFTKGRSIDGAIVDILASAMDSTLPSGIEKLEDLALYSCKVYAEDYDDLPMSDSPSKEEIYYLMELLASNKAGYDVPVLEYGDTTEIQRAYVDCTYYATVLDTVYDVHIDPLKLAVAAQKNDVTEIQRLILETMLDEKNVSYDEGEAVENLFTIACENGCFAMDEDFYSDVFNYDLYVDRTCEKLWVTPFGLANQLGGDNRFLTIKVGSKELNADQTSYFPLDPSKENENMTVTVNYEDEDGNSDMSVYVFRIIKQDPNETTAKNSVVAEIEDMLADVVPEGNEKAQTVVGEVISAADQVVSEGEDLLTVPEKKQEDSSENTDETHEATTYDVTETVPQQTTVSDFEYFKKLVEETYGDENELTGTYSRAEEAKKESKNVLSSVAEIVKDKPEVVVAPTSVIALGALAGYIFTRKKNSAVPTEDTEAEDDDSFKDL